MEKVYIKTSRDNKIITKQGQHIIKALIDYGGKNTRSLNGISTARCYFIGEGGHIDFGEIFECENKLIKQGYKEIFLNKTNQIPLYL